MADPVCFIPHRDAPLNKRILHRLFQAQMWRRYVLDWDRKPGGYGHSREWLDQILRRSRAECLRRAKINARLARRLRRAALSQQAGSGEE